MTSPEPEFVTDELEEIEVRGEPGTCGAWIKTRDSDEWLCSDLSEYGAPECLSKALTRWNDAWFWNWRKEPEDVWYKCDSEGLDLARSVKCWVGPMVKVTHVSAAGRITTTT
jgi:hypothetical protein